MALNPALTSVNSHSHHHHGGPPSQSVPCLIAGNEVFVLTRQHVSYKIAADRDFEGEGVLFLSNFRICLIPRNQGHGSPAVDIPLAGITKQDFEQPAFGANYLKGVVIPVPGRGLDRGFETSVKFKIVFNNGGCQTFLKFFFTFYDYWRTKNMNKLNQYLNAHSTQAFVQEQMAYRDPHDPSRIYVTNPVQPGPGIPDSGFLLPGYGIPQSQPSHHGPGHFGPGHHGPGHHGPGSFPGPGPGRRGGMGPAPQVYPQPFNGPVFGPGGMVQPQPVPQAYYPPQQPGVQPFYPPQQQYYPPQQPQPYPSQPGAQPYYPPQHPQPGVQPYYPPQQPGAQPYYPQQGQPLGSQPPVQPAAQQAYPQQGQQPVHGAVQPSYPQQGQQSYPQGAAQASYPPQSNQAPLGEPVPSAPYFSGPDVQPGYYPAGPTTGNPPPQKYDV